MFVQGRCYKCGGFLAVDNTQDASVCPFCNKPFVVEKAILSVQAAFVQTMDTRSTPTDYDNDFVVEKSVLVRYNGYTKKEIRIPYGISVIGETSFQGMNIESVYIPDGVEFIGAGAFAGCKNLQTVQLPDGVEMIDRDAFNGCIHLSSLQIPDSVIRIEAGALAGCVSLQSVTIPQQIEVLPWRIFEGCISLKTITIPKKVKTIEDYAFAECTGLENIEFECQFASGDGAVGINRIGMNAFRNCIRLEHIRIPETLKYIGNQAFRGCSKLKTLQIPKRVKAVYPLAFADCTGLEQVTFEGDTDLYKGSHPYKSAEYFATFYNCPKLLSVTYNELQKHFWAFPAYMKSQEPTFIENGKCRYCGGEFKGLFEKVCAVCKSPKDY